MKKKQQHDSTAPDERSTRGTLLNAVVVAGSLGMTLFVCICTGVFLGKWLDEVLGTSPWGLIFCSLLGAVSGFWSLYKRVLSSIDGDSRHSSDHNTQEGRWKNS